MPQPSAEDQLKNHKIELDKLKLEEGALISKQLEYIENSGIFKRLFDFFVGYDSFDPLVFKLKSKSCRIPQLEKSIVELSDKIQQQREEEEKTQQQREAEEMIQQQREAEEMIQQQREEEEKTQQQREEEEKTQQLKREEEEKTQQLKREEEEKTQQLKREEEEKTQQLKREEEKIQQQREEEEKTQQLKREEEEKIQQQQNAYSAKHSLSESLNEYMAWLNKKTENKDLFNLDILNLKKNRLKNLLENNDFISMYKGIDSLEMYGNEELVSRFFTVGTDAAKNDCARFVSDLKKLVIDFVFEEHVDADKIKEVKKTLMDSANKMEHRNVFSIVAKSVFDCIQKFFCGVGHRHDFFQPKRKKLADDVLKVSEKFLFKPVNN